MAQTLKALKITVLVDAKGAVKGIKTAKGEVVSLGTQAETAGKRGKGLGSVFRGIGPLMIGSGAAIAGVTAILKNSITAAGDAAEIWSKFDAVFKEHATTARLWVGEFSEAVGRSQSDIAEWASTLQDTFVPMGLARDVASDLSQELVELAVDVASFNNKLDADVIRDFQSALVGNHETLRKYGVVITETTLKQEGITSGIWDGIGAMTEQEKIQARLNIIYKGTTDAQGDAIRTADSYNNRLKRSKSEIKEFSETLGNIFLPAAAKTVGAFGSMADAAAGFLKSLVPATDTQEQIDRLTESIEALGDGWVISAGVAVDLRHRLEKLKEERAALIDILQDQIFVEDKATESTDTQAKSTHDLWKEIVEWQAANAGIISQLPDLSDAMKATEDRLKATDDLTVTLTRSFDSFEDSMARSIVTGGDLEDVLKDLIREMATAIIKAKIIAPLMDEILGTKGAGGAQLGLGEGIAAGFAIGGIPGAIAGAAISILSGIFASAQGGMNQTLPKDTLIYAHKGEDVRITPAGQAGSVGRQIVFAPQYHFHGIVDSEMVRERVAPRLEEDARRSLNNLGLRA